MSGDLTGLSLLVFTALAMVIYWRYINRDHERRLRSLETRIHVNGIRGKSSVTRLLAGLLREGGFTTLAKTTGSAARVIDATGSEHVIHRRGAPTILEQVDIVRQYVEPGIDALVVECMAVKPRYQQYSQDYMVQSDITVITNVREDHQEEMGETLEEIADALALTIPHGGILITAEERPHLRERLRRHAEDRDCRFVYADPAWVRDEDLDGFDYLQYRDNIALGIAVARVLGIGRTKALQGMRKAVPDVGVVRVERHRVRDKEVLWVPLFAINDRESVLQTFEMLQETYGEDATVIGLLNNRWDRGRRAEQFARMVPEELSGYLDHVVTFGGYERPVTQKLVEYGYPRDRITNLGDSRSPSLDDMLDAFAGLITGPRGVLIGMVNIHTEQADRLRAYFAAQRGTEPDEMALSRHLTRMAPSVQRRRRALAHQARRPLPPAAPDAASPASPHA